MTEDAVNVWLGHWVSRQDNGRRALSLRDPATVRSDDTGTLTQVRKPFPDAQNPTNNTDAPSGPHILSVSSSTPSRRNPERRKNRPEKGENRDDLRKDRGDNQDDSGNADERLENIEDHAINGSDVDKHQDTPDNDPAMSGATQPAAAGPATPRSGGKTTASRRAFLAELSDDGKYQKLLALLDCAGVSIQMTCKHYIILTI